MIINIHCLLYLSFFLWILGPRGFCCSFFLVFLLLLLFSPFLLQFTVLVFFKKAAQIFEEKTQMPFSWGLRRSHWLGVMHECFNSFLASGNSAKYRQLQFSDLSACEEQAFVSAASCVCLLLWQFMFLLSSLLKPLEKCKDWKGCTLLPYAISALLTAVSWSY